MMSDLIERLRFTHEHGIFDAQIVGMLASPKEAADEIERLRAALKLSVKFLEGAPLESGFCCCGSSIESHGMGDGHSPVDDLAYYAGQVADQARAALKGEK